MTSGPAGFRGNSVPDGAISTIADVIETLETRSAELPAGDGIRAFTQMYLTTTRHVERAVLERRFADPEYLTRLDVLFARLYLDVLDRLLGGDADVPESWRILFDARARPGISALQFAIAGMNAHINFDLARALVICAREGGIGVGDSPERRADYLVMNRLLADSLAESKQMLVAGPLAAVDVALGQEDDRVALWGIEQAREFAWTTALALEAVDGTPLADALAASLDRITALTSQLLLGVAD